jgi:hypothetical protein
MKSKPIQAIFMMVISLWLSSSSLSASGISVSGQQGNRTDEQKYAGTWTGSYVTNEGVTEKLSYVLSKDEKGQWRGTVKFTNQDGEQAAEFKSLQIIDGKMKGKIEAPGGEVEVTIEGQFQEDKAEGTYAVSPKGTTEVVEKGSWKVSRGAAAKSGQ